MGWEIDVQGFVISCIRLWEVPTILEADPVLSVCLKHALHFLALVIQALNMAWLVCQAILADVRVMSNASLASYAQKIGIWPDDLSNKTIHYTGSFKLQKGS